MNTNSITCVICGRHKKYKPSKTNWMVKRDITTRFKSGLQWVHTDCYTNRDKLQASLARFNNVYPKGIRDLFFNAPSPIVEYLRRKKNE